MGKRFYPNEDPIFLGTETVITYSDDSRIVVDTRSSDSVTE